MTPWLVRPDVVDGFLPIAGGLGLRAWLGQGLTDPHHPAATVTVLVLSLSALLLYLFTRTGLTASVLPGWDNLSSRCTP